MRHFCGWVVLILGRYRKPRLKPEGPVGKNLDWCFIRSQASITESSVHRIWVRCFVFDITATLNTHLHAIIRPHFNIEFDFDVSVCNCVLSTDASKSNSTFSTVSDKCSGLFISFLLYKFWRSSLITFDLLIRRWIVLITKKIQFNKFNVSSSFWEPSLLLKLIKGCITFILRGTKSWLRAKKLPQFNLKTFDWRRY